MESDLIAELERRIAECGRRSMFEWREHEAALTAALTLAKALKHIGEVHWNSSRVAREALALAEKQIGGSDGK